MAKNKPVFPFLTRRPNSGIQLVLGFYRRDPEEMGFTIICEAEGVIRPASTPDVVRTLNRLLEDGDVTLGGPICNLLRLAPTYFPPDKAIKRGTMIEEEVGSGSPYRFAVEKS